MAVQNVLREWNAKLLSITAVAVMSQDSLFPSTQYADDIMGRNLKVVSLHGEHLRFSYEPVEVLGEIALAQSMRSAA